MREQRVITTARLRLRPIAPADFPHWRAFYETEHSHFVGGPKSAEDAWWKMCQFVGHWVMRGFGYWSVETKEGEYCGRVGLEQPNEWPEPELGWSFLSSATGQGYATEAAIAVLEDAKATLKPETVVSFVHVDNTASARVAERMGAIVDEQPGYDCPYPDHLIYRHQMGGAA